MKGIIEYNLPEETEEFQTAINGIKYKLLIWDLDQYLRGEIKYNSKLSHDTETAFQLIRDKISQELIDNNISIE